MSAIQVDLEEGKFMEVRIKDGMIEEIFYQGSTESTTHNREESRDIQEWLSDILKADVKKLKQILSQIPKDREFYDYGKQILYHEKARRETIYEDAKKQANAELARLKEAVDVCSFSG